MDNWPQFSDAVVDYYFCKKLAYFFIRRSQQPLCLMMDDKSGELVLYAVNDHQHSCDLRYRVTDTDTGEVIVQACATAAADASTALHTIPDDGKAHFYAIEWDTQEGCFLNHYLHGQAPFDYEWYMKCLKKLRLDEFEGFEGENA